MRGVRANTLVLVPVHFHRCFHPTILGADHEDPPFVLRRFPKEHGMVLIISVFLNRGLTAFAVVLGFKDNCDDGLHASRSYLTGDSPIDVLWITHPFRFF